MKIEDVFPLIYCVNLDKRKDRWYDSKKQFSKMKLENVKRFSAIEHQIGPIGCLLSHIEILKKSLAQNKNVLIFEDDVEFVDGAEDIVGLALDELQTLPWKMFYLGGNILKPFFQETEHLARLQHCQSTHAYGVNKEFLPELVRFLTNVKPYFIDVLYADAVIPQVEAYITIPMLAIQKADYSNIEKKVMDYSVPIERYNTFLRRKNAQI